MKIINAIYNFIVGDMIILIGVIITLIVLAVINGLSALSALRDLSGILLILAIVVTLFITLRREAGAGDRH